MNTHRFCIAPMLDWTDRHARYFLRLFSPNIRLYTEMITTGALIHGPRDQLLTYNTEEHPLALQLGGSDPEALAKCCEFAQARAYDEINLNVGCPSNRVQSGQFGACLMAQPDLVAHCITTMRNTTDLPVTIKCRLGIDDLDTYQHLHEFVSLTHDAGCNIFIVHARKAWLQGLSPKQNREIPPLRYDDVYRLKTDFPSLDIIINGGIKTLDDTKAHLTHVDGVMIGREAYQNPAFLLDIDDELFFQRKIRFEETGAQQTCEIEAELAKDLIQPRMHIAEAMIPYIQNQLEEGTPLHAITRHMLGLFNQMPGARSFRRLLSEQATRKSAGIEVWIEALNQVLPSDSPIDA